MVNFLVCLSTSAIKSSFLCSGKLQFCAQESCSFVLRKAAILCSGKLQFCAQENCSFVLRKAAVLCSGKLQFCAQENCSFAIPSLQLSKAISIDAKYTYTTSAPAVTDPDFLCYSGYFLGQCVQRYVNSVWTAKLFSAVSCWNSY